MKEKQYQWFFDLSQKELTALLVQLNTRTRLMGALRDVHGGESYANAAKAWNVGKQSIYYWLNTTTTKLGIK